MNTVTAIEVKKGQKGKVNIFLDGGFAFSLSLSLAADIGLHPGQILSSAELEELRSAELVHRSLDKALKYLSPRPRSEAEIKAKLYRDGYDADTIGQVLTRLRERGLVDDVAFAQYWVENRENFKPRSRRLLESELKRKGINAEIVTESVTLHDDMPSAYRAAKRKARSLAGLDYPGFRKRLAAFLRRRGFSFELIDHTIDQVWLEHSKSEPDL
jgi:regulatory protein